MDGPDVSLKGSPTVSPTTVAVWVSDPLGVVPGAAGVGHEERQQHADDGGTGEHAAERFRSRARIADQTGCADGRATPGSIISLRAAALVGDVDATRLV